MNMLLDNGEKPMLCLILVCVALTEYPRLGVLLKKRGMLGSQFWKVKGQDQVLPSMYSVESLLVTS